MLARRAVVFLALVLAVPPSATAQLRVSAGIGATWSSTLVHDSIVVPITVRPHVAPTLALALEGSLDSIYRAGFQLTVSRSDLEVREAGIRTDIVSLTVWEPALRVRRRFGRVRAGLLVGLRVYHAARPVGLFQDGGTTSPLIGAEVGVLGPRVAGLGVALDATWSLATFSTTALALAGFTGEQSVNRVSLRATVRWPARAP